MKQFDLFVMLLTRKVMPRFTYYPRMVEPIKKDTDSNATEESKKRSLKD